MYMYVLLIPENKSWHLCILIIYLISFNTDFLISLNIFCILCHDSCYMDNLCDTAKQSTLTFTSGFVLRTVICLLRYFPNEQV